MKQGRADSSRPEGRKMEPTPKAINPGWADGLGQHMGNHAMDAGTFKPRITPMDAGRGFEAPAIRNTSRKGGSQGSY